MRTAIERSLCGKKPRIGCATCGVRCATAICTRSGRLATAALELAIEDAHLSEEGRNRLLDRARQIVVRDLDGRNGD